MDEEMEMQGFGKFLVLIGIIFAVAGIGMMFFDKIPFLGKLPGDISIKRENFQFYFPITTSVLLSILISVIAWLISHFRK